jgi:hypothetical protein
VPAPDPSRLASCAQLTCQGLLHQIGVAARVLERVCSDSWRHPRSLDAASRVETLPGYTPDKTSSLPVLSPNFSTFTPNLSIRLKDRFANGVPFGYLR